MSAIWVPSKLSDLTGNIVAVSPTSSTKTVVVRGAPSQTASLQEWQNSSGTALSWIQANGVAYFPYAAIGGGPFGSTQFSVSSQSATNKALVVVAAAAQSANLQEWQNSSGTNLSKLDAAGNLIVRGDRGISSALVGGTNTPQIFVQNYSASDIAAVVKGAASQSANLQEWQDSSGNVTVSVRGAAGAHGHIVMSSPAGQGAGSGIDFYSNDRAYSGLIQLDGSGNVVLRNNNSGGGTYVDFTNGAYFRSAAGTPLKLNASGSGAAAVVTPAAATDKGLVVQGASSQTANLQEWQDSNGTALSSVDKSGYICVPTGSGAPGTNPTSGGGLYYDTANGKLYAWDGSAWKSVALS